MIISVSVRDSVSFNPQNGSWLTSLGSIEDEIDLLKVKLQGKRRVAALLKALEEKEMNRIRRLQEITALAKKLKYVLVPANGQL